jgi:hypothetical protein
MARKCIDDGLTRWQRYRLKDIVAYRKRKAAYARTPEERAKRTEYMRIWRDKNRERHNELARQSHHRNKHKHIGKAREQHLRRNYGITSHDFERMLKIQNGRCGICKTDNPARGRFHVDHNHETGSVRMLLCSRCNGSLGWFEKYRKEITNYADTVW